MIQGSRRAADRLLESALLMASVALALLMLVAPARAELVLNEFLANPGRDYDGDGAVDTRLDEWVEVYNAGFQTLDLTAYWLRDGLNDAPNLNLFGLLAPGETAVFFGGHAVAWQIEHGVASVGLSLNNGGDSIVLMKTDPVDPMQLLVIDSFTYGAHVGAVDRACGRVPDGDQWALFDAYNPYGGGLFPQGTGCEPSPGEANTCGQGTASEPRHWSGVKTHWQ